MNQNLSENGFQVANYSENKPRLVDFKNLRFQQKNMIQAKITKIFKIGSRLGRARILGIYLFYFFLLSLSESAKKKSSFCFSKNFKILHTYIQVDDTLIHLFSLFIRFKTFCTSRHPYKNKTTYTRQYLSLQ